MRDHQPEHKSSARESSATSLFGAVRPLVVVAAALIALQSSQNLDIMKLAFAAVASLALAGSILHTWETRDSALVRAAQPWLITSVVIAGIVGVSLPVALANGTAVGSWVRDAASYVLVAAAPWLAVDLGASVSPRVATWATAAAGCLATVSFAIIWVQRRNIVDLPIDRLVLPSGVLAAAFYALAVARSIWSSRNKLIWAFAASAVILLLLATGTRTTLLLAPIPIILLIDAVHIGGRVTLRKAFAPALASLVVMGVFLAAGMLGSVTPPQAAPNGLAAASPAAPNGLAAASPAAPNAVARIGTLGDVISGQDESLRERWAQTIGAWDIFVSSPLVGRGLGVPIRWKGLNGQIVALTTDANGMIVAFSADTPLTILAKFGLGGIVIWVALGCATILSLHRLRRLGPSGSTARSTLLGLATGLVAGSALLPTLEDKGTGLALILVLGLAFSVIRASGSNESGLVDRA